ncbi:phosphoethanolamine N-methyltransferase 2-like [Diadema antillarum]|uniref:phosphoethanolamine N-methyltransferase 2-like n=1 Tax=Diadema antillarum TaxID=105358 RepID=UPI003A878FA9
MSFVDSLARNLRQPQRGIVGWLVKRFMLPKNAYLEEEAAALCNIKPDHHVLELGFGPGIGLKKAAEYVEKGVGKVHGVDFSPAMVVEAINNLPQEIEDEKIELVLGNVASLPYRDESMDSIFHANCYYFWPDIPLVATDLLRVLKPGGLMVTVLSLEGLKTVDSMGWMKYATWDPEEYTKALREAGFADVKMEDKTSTAGHEFQVILAFKSCLQEDATLQACEGES